MSNTVDITFAAQDRGAEEAIKRVTAENEKLSKQLEKLAEKSKKSSQESVKGLNKLEQSLQKIGEKHKWAAQKSTEGAGQQVKGFEKIERAMHRAGDKGKWLGDHQAASLARLKEAFTKTSSAASTGFSKSNQVMGRMTATITGTIGGLLSIRAAVRAIGDEWAATARKQESARVATLDPAMALRSAIFAMQDDGTVTGKTLEAKLMEIAKRNKVDLGVAARVFEQTSSARGSGTNQDVLNAMDAAFAKGVTNEFEATTLAKRSLNLSKVSGTTDMNVNMGIIQELGSASMVKNFEQIGESLVPAVIGLTKLGNTVEEAEELVSATTHLITDDMGDVSARAIQILAQQVMSFHPEPNEKGKLKGRITGNMLTLQAKGGKLKGKFTGRDNEGEFIVPEEQVTQFTQEKSMPERMRMLREFTELRRLFLSRLEPGSLHLPTKSEEALRGLIRGDEREMTELQKVKDVIIGPSTPENQAKLAGQFQEKIATMDATQLNQRLEAELAQKSATQQANLKNTANQRAAEARKVLTETLDTVDLPGIDAAFRMVMKPQFEAAMKRVSETGGTPEFAAAHILESIDPKSQDPLLQGNMTPEDVGVLQEAAARLRRQGQKQGPIAPAEERAKGLDPQMEENNKLLREMVGEMKAGRPIGKFAPYAPAASMISRNRESVMNQ